MSDVHVGPARPTKKRKEPEGGHDLSEEPKEKKIKNEILEIDNQKNLNEEENKKEKVELTEESINALKNLPDKGLYEWSYSHFSEISTVLVSSESEFVVTVSIDGFLKVWKRTFENIEFVKIFHPSKNSLIDCQMSFDGNIIVTLSCDDESGQIFSIKVFDLRSVILSNVIEISSFIPNKVEIFDDKCESRLRGYKILVSEKDSQNFHIFLPFSSKNSPEKSFIKTSVLSSSKISDEEMNKRFKDEVNILKYNDIKKIFVYSTRRGHIEMIDNEESLDTSSLIKRMKVSFKMKSETDLFDLVKKNAFALSISFCKSGKMMSIFGSDRVLRIFDTASAKIILRLDESLPQLEKLQLSKDENSDSSLFSLNGLEFGKRIEIEKKIDKIVEMSNSVDVLSSSKKKKDWWKSHSLTNCSCGVFNTCFDELEKFVIFGSMHGIKFLSLETKKIERMIGKHENNCRFINVGLIQGRPKVERGRLSSLKAFRKKFSFINESDTSIIPGLPLPSSEQKGGNQIEIQSDPLLICSSFKKNFLFLFSQRLFDEELLRSGLTRDVIDDSDIKMHTQEELNDENNLISSDVNVLAQISQNSHLVQKKKPDSVQLPEKITMHTQYGDIKFKLFGKLCPMAVENFTTHAKNGYYNGHIFHRVIKGFMIQAGDPNGDGTGGESIWKKNFRNECCPDLKFDGPFKLAMANVGNECSNGSQFFITTVQTGWLNGKHTLFGEVTEGFEVVTKIERAKTSKYEKPLEDIKIISFSFN